MWKKIYSGIEENIFYEKYDKICKAIAKLEESHTLSAKLDQKAHKLYTLRLNIKERLFIAIHTLEGHDQPSLFLLHVMENHRYNRIIAEMRNLTNAIKNNNILRFSEIELNATPAPQETEQEYFELEIKPARLFRHHLIELDTTQQALIKCTDSFMATGNPGTGKSSSAVLMIEDIRVEQSNNQPIIVLSKTKKLADKLQEDLESLQDEKNLDLKDISFVTVDEYARAMLGSTEIDIKNSLDDFIYYIKTHEKITKLPTELPKKDQKDTYIQLELACKFPIEFTKKQEKFNFFVQSLFNELMLIAPLNGYYHDSKELVIASNSYFDIQIRPEIRNVLINLLHKYRNYLSDQNIFDYNISSWSTENAAEKPIIICDEAQLLSVNYTYHLAQRSQKLYLFMDENQNVTSGRSTLRYKHNIQKISHPNSKIFRLETSYRCSKQVSNLAFHTLDLRDILSDHSLEEREQKQPMQQEGHAFIFNNHEATNSILTKFKKTEIIIISEAEKTIVHNLFPGYIVCHPSELPGLEFDCAIIYQPFNTSNKEVWRKINSKLKAIDQLNFSNDIARAQPNIKRRENINSTHESMLLQQFFMIITRARHTVCIVQKDNDESIKEISEYFSKKCEHSTDYLIEDENTKTSDEEWIDRLCEMLENENSDIAQVFALVRQNLFLDTPINNRWGKFLQTLPHTLNSTIRTKLDEFQQLKNIGENEKQKEIILKQEKNINLLIKEMILKNKSPREDHENTSHMPLYNERINQLINDIGNYINNNLLKKYTPSIETTCAISVIIQIFVNQKNTTPLKNIMEYFFSYEIHNNEDLLWVANINRMIFNNLNQHIIGTDDDIKSIAIEFSFTKLIALDCLYVTRDKNITEKITQLFQAYAQYIKKHELYLRKSKTEMIKAMQNNELYLKQHSASSQVDESSFNIINMEKIMLMDMALATGDDEKIIIKLNILQASILNTLEKDKIKTLKLEHIKEYTSFLKIASKILNDKSYTSHINFITAIFIFWVNSLMDDNKTINPKDLDLFDIISEKHYTPHITCETTRLCFFYTFVKIFETQPLDSEYLIKTLYMTTCLDSASKEMETNILNSLKNASLPLLLCLQLKTDITQLRYIKMYRALSWITKKETPLISSGLLPCFLSAFTFSVKIFFKGLLAYFLKTSPPFYTYISVHTLKLGIYSAFVEVFPVVSEVPHTYMLEKFGSNKLAYYIINSLPKPLPIILTLLLNLYISVSFLASSDDPSIPTWLDAKILPYFAITTLVDVAIYLSNMFFESKLKKTMSDCKSTLFSSTPDMNKLAESARKNWLESSI